MIAVTNAVVEAIASSASKVQPGATGVAEAQVAASAIGKAVAKALTEAGILLNVEGQGVARGSATAQAQAIATATAQAIGKAIAEVTSGDSNAVAKVLTYFNLVRTVIINPDDVWTKKPHIPEENRTTDILYPRSHPTCSLVNLK